MAFTGSRSGAFLDRATNTKAHQKEMSLTGSRGAPRLPEKHGWDQHKGVFCQEGNGNAGQIPGLLGGMPCV